MKSGIFGLFALDGAPPDPRDDAVLFAGIADSLSAGGCRIAGRDARLSACHLHRRDDEIAMLLGDLDDVEVAAGRLGLDLGGNPAALALAAHDRWGKDTPVQLAGEWLLVRWHAPSRTLTLLMAECIRDVCYFSTDGRRAAIAPELMRLARLDWVNAAFDPDMLLRAMGRAPLRRSMGGRTILKDVMAVLPGQCVTIRAGGVATGVGDPLPPPPLASIAFEDGMAEIEALLRRIMRQRLAQWGGGAFLLSGGLDSSLLAWLGAVERCADQKMFFLTSAAPEGSGLEDETAWAGIVAQHLELPLVRVAPRPAADIYSPVARAFAAIEGPLLSPRHYLYEALENHAVAGGAAALFDGIFGEFTVTNHGAVFRRPSRLDRVRRFARGVRESLRDARLSVIESNFHVQPSRSALAHLGEALTATSMPSARRLTPDQPLGFEAGVAKVALNPTDCADPRLRYLFPFRDRRLTRLMASYPAAFVTQDGLPRAPARALLRGRLPDAIALRRSKMAFSPTYYPMLQAHAAQAIDRVADQRAAGAEEWLDLAWLERTLRSAGQGARLSPDTAFRVQSTAVAAEFFRWWRDTARQA